MAGTKAIVVTGMNVTIEDPIPQDVMLKRIERIGRVCYKSEDRINQDTAVDFARKLIKSGHESVLEHATITVRFICDRGVSHELVRHRLAAYSQESTRYCDYSKDETAGIHVISPIDFMGNLEQFQVWCDAMRAANEAYQKLREMGCPPQIARGVLPNSLKTEIVATMNLRQWRHVLRLRTSKAAHPQMRHMMNLLLAQFHGMYPVIFGDIPLL